MMALSILMDEVLAEDKDDQQNALPNNLWAPTSVDHSSNENNLDSMGSNDRPSVKAEVSYFDLPSSRFQHSNPSDIVRRANFWKRANFWRKRANFWRR